MSARRTEVERNTLVSERAIIRGIERACEDIAAGRLVDHQKAMDELDAIIAAAASGRGKRD